MTGPDQSRENVSSKNPIEMDRGSMSFAAVQTTRMPMIFTDPNQPDNPIVFANQAFLHMTGYEEHEVLGRNCRFLQGPGSDPSTVAAIRAAIRDRTDIAVELLNYRKDGSSFWNGLFISPVYDENGNLINFFASQLDVSRRRDAEDALRQSQKMEAVGQLTGGIAHDFNNMLQIQTGYMDRVKSLLPHGTNPKIIWALTQIEAATTKSTKLTQHLLSFARRQRLEERPVNLNELIRTVIDMAERTIGPAITIEHHQGENLHNVHIDPTQAESALLNIMINARDAQPSGGRIDITTRNVTLAKRDPSDPLEPGDYVEVSLRDKGQGIPKAVLQRVMEPFFTTKETGSGTGLGLSMVYGFMSQSKGLARIESVEGEGTTVTLLFPATDAYDPLEEDGAVRTVAQAAAKHTVLVVEDNKMVATLSQETLEDLGFNVVVAETGVEAARKLADGLVVDILFTDVVMPGGMDGFALAREVRRTYPRIKILITSGFSDPTQADSDLDREWIILRKPYQPSMLAERMKGLLAELEPR